MKPQYVEYVNHMLRSYFLHGDSAFRNRADQLNFESCQRVLSKTDPDKIQILREVFSGSKEHVTDAVRSCADSRAVDPTDVWNVVRFVSKEIARDRTLI